MANSIISVEIFTLASSKMAADMAAAKYSTRTEDHTKASLWMGWGMGMVFIRGWVEINIEGISLSIAKMAKDNISTQKVKHIKANIKMN